MFLREDGTVVTQAEHSRLSGELALLLGQFLRQDVARLAGAIALHDWPHFGGSHVDNIEIGQKSDADQRMLVDRLAADLPFDDFTELIMRMHWRRLTDESDVELRDAVSDARIEELRRAEEISATQLERLDVWTDVCDALAYYVSLSLTASPAFELPSLSGDDRWELTTRIEPGLLEIASRKLVDAGEDAGEGAGRPATTEASNSERSGAVLRDRVSLVSYEGEPYPELLVPSMYSVVCTFTQQE